jgi:uncharacterized repeat protein (TIGR01451 family)
MKLVAASSVTGIAMAGMLVSPAFAWHPKGAIIKSVQNQTAGGNLSDANDEQNAVAAKPGDLLKYTIVVSNNGDADSKGYNDMAQTKLTDTLPEGVELVINPSLRTITEDLGLIKPGQKVTKEYVVKVTSETDGTVLSNKACFTGNSTANDNPQEGCDNAVVKVSNPKTPETPKPETPKTETPATTTPAPTQPQVLATSTDLPNTGAGDMLVPVGAVAGIGYAANMLRLKFRANREG